MAEEWYEMDQGQRKEPVSEHDVKQDAPDVYELKPPAADVYNLNSPGAADQIKPDDRLFPPPTESKPKPVPPEDVTPDNPRNDVRSALPKGEGEKATIARIAASLAHQCKVAFRLLGKWLERAELTGWVLPHAYRALGKHVYGEGAYRADFPNPYVRLDGLRAEIALLQYQPPVEGEVTTFMMKAQAAAKAARHPLALLVLNGRMNNAFRELGKAVFEKIGEEGEATRPIREAQTRIEKLGAEIAELSQAQPGQVVTPNHILVAGGVFILVLLLFLGKWLFFGT